MLNILGKMFSIPDIRQIPTCDEDNITLEIIIIIQNGLTPHLNVFANPNPKFISIILGMQNVISY
jgi:hypothetical protein